MFEHNMKYKALIDTQHRNNPLTTNEVHDDRNRGQHSRQGSLLLSEAAGRNPVVRPQEELYRPSSDVSAAESFLRGDKYTPGTGCDECEESDFIGLDPVPEFGWQVNGLIMILLVSSAGAGYALVWAAFRVFHAIYGGAR